MTKRWKLGQLDSSGVGQQNIHCTANRMSKRRGLAVVTVALFVHTLLLSWSSSRHTPNWDEIGHLPAGLSHHALRNFELYEVNPPLARLLASYPVQFCNPAYDWQISSRGPGVRNDFSVGERFLELNGERSFWLFAVARWGCIPFSWLGAVMCLSLIHI